MEATNVTTSKEIIPLQLLLTQTFPEMKRKDIAPGSSLNIRAHDFLNINNSIEKNKAIITASTIDVFAATPARFALFSPRRLPMLWMPSVKWVSIVGQCLRTELKLQLRAQKEPGRWSKRLLEEPTVLQDLLVRVCRNKFRPRRRWVREESTYRLAATKRDAHSITSEVKKSASQIQLTTDKLP